MLPWLSIVLHVVELDIYGSNKLKLEAATKSVHTSKEDWHKWKMSLYG
jgi:hypothetical protein